MKYVMESTGGMNAMANSFVDSTMQKVRMNFRVKDIGTKKWKLKKILCIKDRNDIPER